MANSITRLQLCTLTTTLFVPFRYDYVAFTSFQIYASLRGNELCIGVFIFLFTTLSVMHVRIIRIAIISELESHPHVLKFVGVIDQKGH